MEIIGNEVPKHIKLPRSEITPEFIAKIRKLRAIEREKRESVIRFDPKFDFIKRDLLEIQHEGNQFLALNDGNSINVKIMTYNILAQALIRREIFPESHDAIRWSHRSKTLLNEIKFYNADIICLQEVDAQQWDKFWLPMMEKIGYNGHFYKGHRTKVHGISIFWKSNKFSCIDLVEINLDDEIACSNEYDDIVKPRTKTRNAGLITALRFKNPPNHYKAKRKGILIGTTHLFWHPFGTFERTRQLFIILQKYKRFMLDLNEKSDGRDITEEWLSFLTGDFNSQPSDPPYLALTSKPVKYTADSRTLIECSTAYTFSRRRNGEDDYDNDEEETDEENEIMKCNPKDPRPSIFNPTVQEENLVRSLEILHNSIDLKATSLYSLAYRLVHPANAVFENMHNGEPELSHCAISWSGLLDYIFLIDKWDGSNVTKTTDTGLEAFERRNFLKINALLRMPRRDEMPKHIQPHESEFPSDHLSMICDLKIKM